MRAGAVIDHAAFNAADPAWYVEFFRAVFGMEVVREVREETGALRQVWLDGGVQIDRGEERPNGLITHLSLRTPDMALAVQDALARGAAGVEGGVRDKVKIMIGGGPRYGGLWSVHQCRRLHPRRNYLRRGCHAAAGQLSETKRTLIRRRKWRPM